MKIEIIDRGGYKSADRLKKILTDKLTKLEKYFGEDAKARVVCSKQTKLDKLEITVTAKGALYRTEVVSDSMYNNIDLALPKLESQIVRTRSKLKEKPKKGLKHLEIAPLALEFLEEEPEELPAIYKHKTFDLDPIMVEDARFNIERLGHDFYAFLNAETGKVNIIYRRRDGKFGLIDLKY